MYAMAKLSVYNTIDRSQLGGKFVPLIQSGVNNYKILASDLGKEYHPGDAIEITDTGEINVNYDPSTLRLSGSGLEVKTDAARGVFGGSNGIYIASADSSINITSSGIKVNAGYGLGVNSSGLYVRQADNSIVASPSGIYVHKFNVASSLASGYGLIVGTDSSLYVKSADDSIAVSEHGIKVNPWDGLGADSHGLYVEAADTTISVVSDGVKVRTGYGLIANDYGLCVKPADNSIDTSYAGIKVNPSAITGSGLVTTNGAIGVNVNTATGIIVKDNKLYLNSGDGLETSNNTLSVKAADHSIAVGPSGISVYYGSGLMLNSSGLLSAHIGSGLRFSSTGAIETTGITATSLVDGATNIKTLDDTGYLYASATRLAGYGLKSANYEDTVLAVKAADNSIGVSTGGIKVNLGSGMRMHMDGIMVGDLDASIGVEKEGIKVLKDNNTLKLRNTGLYVDTAYVSGAIAGEGLVKGDDGKLNVKTDGSSIGVSSHGIKVNLADNSIGVSGDGIKVNPSALAGAGLKAHSHGTLYVRSANNFIDSNSSGVGLNVINLYSHVEANSSNIEYRGGLNAIVATADDGTKITSLYSGSGISINNSGSLDVNIDNSKGLYFDKGKISVYADSGSLGFTSIGALYVKDKDPGWGLESRSGTYYVKSADNSIGVSPSGIYVHKSNVASSLASGYGLIVGTGDSLYVKSANDSIEVSENGIKVNTGYGLSSSSDLNGLGVKAANKSIGVSGSGVEVNVGPGLILAHNGISVYTTSGLLVGSDGVRVNLNGSTNIKTSDSEYLYASATYMAGYGLEAGNSDTRLSVKSANNSIDVTEDGIKVNPSAIAGGGLYVGPSNGKLYVNTGLGTALRNGYVDVNAPWVAHSGLAAVHSDSSRIVVKAADNTILVGGSGIRVNTDVISGGGAAASDLVGQGLVLGVDDTLYVKSADSSITVQPEGIKVNPGNGLLIGGSGVGLCVKSANDSVLVGSTGIRVNTMGIAGDGLGGANNTLYVNSAWIAGHGLMSNASGKLEIYCGSGLALDTSSGKVYVTSALTPDFGKGMWLASDNDSLLSVYAGSGLMFDTQNRVSVYAGSGLTLVGPEGEASLQVKAGGNNTISVFESGIEVNAGPGLCYAGSLYIQSADRSINVANDGITVNYGDGLFMNRSNKLAVYAGSGLQISEVEKKLTVYAGSGLGFDTYGNSLEVKNADNSISVTSDGIKVAEGFGLPDYSAGVTATQNTEYTADTNCWMYMEVSNSSSAGGAYVEKSIVIDGITVAGLSAYYWTRIAIMVPCKKGSTYQFKNKNTGQGSYTFTVYKCLE